MGDDKNTDGDLQTELLSRLNRLLKRLEEKEEPQVSRAAGAWASCKSFFSSTFFISVVGGVLLAWLPFQWQDRAGRQREKEAANAATLERNERLAYEFAKDFPRSLHLVWNIRRRQLWMEQPPAREVNARFNDGRSFAETRDHVERLTAEYLGLRPAASVCNQLAASFPTSTNLVAAATALSASVTASL